MSEQPPVTDDANATAEELRQRAADDFARAEAARKAQENRR